MQYELKFEPVDSPMPCNQIEDQNICILYAKCE